MTPLVLRMTNVIGAWQQGRLDVILEWNVAEVAFLHHYTLHQARKFNRHTGPWREIDRLPAINLAYVRNVDEKDNLSWYVTATNEAGQETPPSNTVDLYKSPPKAIVSNPGRLPT